MKEERMKVLEMLEKKVITAEEAQRLLELLTKPGKGEKRDYCFTEDFSEKAGAFNEKVETLVKDFAQKLEAVAKDVEPKLKKATQIIIEKTASAVDEVSKAFHENCNCETENTCGCGCDCKPEEDDNEPKEN